jgi:hypothetical protein
MFQSLPQDHLQGASLDLSAYHVFASRFVICLCWYVDVCPLFVFVPPVPVSVLSGRQYIYIYIYIYINPTCFSPYPRTIFRGRP